MSSDSESEANESVQNSGGEEDSENGVDDDEQTAEILPAEEKEVTWNDLVTFFVIIWFGSREIFIF